MLVHLWGIIAATTLFSFVDAQDASGTVLPPILPLALKSPYLHAWTSNSNVTFSFPMFWNKDNLGWEGMIRVDDHTYQWLGRSSDANPEPANLTSTQITPTSTIFSYLAGPAQLNVTFLSPIESSDPIRQSIPFAYIALNVSFVDGAQHHVQVYMDISGEWLAATPLELMTWSTNIVGSASFHQIQRNSVQPLIETTQDRAEDIISVLATKSGSDVSLVPGLDRDCRVQFRDNGVVTGSSSLTAPAQVGFPYPVFSITKDLGTISSTASPVVFAIGAYRNVSVSFVTSTGETQSRQPLFSTQYTSVSDVVDAFLSDYPNAQARADNVDAQIGKAASNVSEIYANFVSLTARQAMAGTELTIAKGSDGNWNNSDVKMFMKNIGNSNRTSPVEAIYASFPFFLSINTTYAGQLLSPLLEFQDSSSNTQAYAARDIGDTYPRASNENMQHQQPVEHTSSMLIMTLAHAKGSQDSTLISRHYSLLRRWAEFLVNSTMDPPDVITIDGEAQAKNTNLILKGIIALNAMSEISSLVKQTDDSSRYSKTASDNLNQLLPLTLTSNNEHFLPRPNANDVASWTQMYNLYADTLLGTNLIDKSVYQSQASFYQTQVSHSNYGLPISSTNTFGNMAWTLFTAATISNSSIRDNVISPLWEFVTSVNNTGPLVTNYTVSGFDSRLASGSASPAMGAAFAPLVSSLITGSSGGLGGGSGTTGNGGPGSGGTLESGSKHSIAGPVAGGVVGGLVIISLLALGVVLWRRRSRKPIAKKEPTRTAFTPSPFVSSVPRDGEYSPGLTSASEKRRQIDDIPDVPVEDRSILPESTASSEPEATTPTIVPELSSESPPQTQIASSQAPMGSNGDIEVLRAEVQALRQAMQHNVVVIGGSSLPPPSYTPRP
ncbi:hypothetical protein QCA50_011503 [Cerrena zonata]|uniref:DUF1793-domain-containing protein n=1 Tax=Cerrena zonata TaxID=2478898 RepID=A0AAW0FV87_9APHY